MLDCIYESSAERYASTSVSLDMEARSVESAASKRSTGKQMESITSRNSSLVSMNDRTGWMGNSSDGPELTTSKELWGWYFFEAASSGFSGSVLPIFLPLLLVTIATEKAWEELGISTPEKCDALTNVNCLKCVPGRGSRLQTMSGLEDLPKLRVHVGSVGINPISYTTVVLGISIIFQLFAFISAGPLVDYGARRKMLMTVTTVVGSAACWLCLLITKPDLWWLGAVLLIVGNVSYGLSTIAYNSYLPLLTEATSEMQEAKRYSPINEQQLLRNKVENEISLVGVTIGAVSGAVCVVVSFAFSFVPNVSSSGLLRAACAIGGVWWLLGYIPGLMWLKTRARPDLPSSAKPWLGWTNIATLIKESKHHKYAMRFLLIFFIYSDGFTTINQIGVLYAQQELCMTTPQLALLAVLVNVSAMFGNPVMALVQRKFSWDNSRMLILGLSLMSILPVYGVVGYFTPDGSFGLKHVSEMYIFACWYGFSLGALLSYSRTLFIDFIPIGKEGAMFSLWSLSSKGSAWVGPFLVAAMVQITNSLRSAFVYTLVVVWIPIILLYLFIDNREGLIQSGRLSIHLGMDSKPMAGYELASQSQSYSGSGIEGGRPSLRSIHGGHYKPPGERNVTSKAPGADHGFEGQNLRVIHEGANGEKNVQPGSGAIDTGRS